MSDTMAKAIVEAFKPFDDAAESLRSALDVMKLDDPEYLRSVLADVLSVMPKGWHSEDWYCSKCDAYLSGAQIKNDGTHWACGTQLEGAFVSADNCLSLLKYARLLDSEDGKAYLLSGMAGGK